MITRNLSITQRPLKINVPERILPIYTELESYFLELLNDEQARVIIMSLNYTAHRGNYWREARDKLRPWTDNWTIHNKAWHSYIIFENVRRVASSLHESQAIWDTYQSYGQLTPEYWNTLHAKHIYPTRAQVLPIIKSPTRPELPRKAVFILDYSISEKQFYHAEDHSQLIKISKTEWMTYDLLLPLSIRESATSGISRPRFTRRPDGELEGAISYDCVIPDAPGDNEMGIDIGKINLYCATIRDTNGKLLTFLPSRRLSNLVQKIDLLRGLLAHHYEIINKFKKSGRDNTLREYRREVEVRRISKKTSRLMKYAEELAADEIAKLCVEHKVGTVHLESLSWLGTRGGKWDHSKFQSIIKDRLELDGVRVLKVNAAYSSTRNPVTREVGRKSGRDIVWSDGSRLDRDVTSSINLACEKSKIKTKSLSKRDLGKFTPKRPRVHDSRAKRRAVLRERVLAASASNHNSKHGAVVVVSWPSVTRVGCSRLSWFSYYRGTSETNNRYSSLLPSSSTKSNTN